jgi:hypothetical protein
VHQQVSSPASTADEAATPTHTRTTPRCENGVTITDRLFLVSIPGESVDEVRGYWGRLSAGASIIEPFAASAWSPGFGMVAGGFGVDWILDVGQPASPWSAWPGLRRGHDSSLAAAFGSTPLPPVVTLRFEEDAHPRGPGGP